MQPHLPPIATPPRPVMVRRSLVMLGIAAVLGVVAYALMESDDPGQVQAPPVPATTLKPPLADVVAQLPQGYRDLPPDPPPAPPPEPTPPAEPPAPPAPPQAGTPSSTGQTQRPQIPARGTTPHKPAEPKRWLITKPNVQKPP